MDQHHIFIDTETSGLDPRDSCIIELAAIRTDEYGKILASYCDRIEPDRSVSPGAAKVNGYSKAEWAKTQVPFKTALHTFNKSIVRGDHDRVVFVGHFSDFDRSFLRSDCERYSVEIPLYTRAWLCTGALVWPFVFGGHLKSRKLGDVCKFLEIRFENAHSATADVKACCDVYWELMRRYNTAFLARKAVENTGLKHTLGFAERILSGLG